MGLKFCFLPAFFYVIHVYRQENDTRVVVRLIRVRCTAISLQVRLVRLHPVLRHCVALFFCLKQERSRRCRLKLLETASSDNRADSLFSPHAFPSCIVSVILTRESTPPPESGVSGGGPCICGEPSASQSH